MAAATIPIAAGGISAIGSLMAGQSTANTLDAQAQLALENADEARQKGEYDAARQQLISGQRQGQAIAGFAASGVQTDTGSAFHVLQSNAINSEMDRLNILHGADIRAINYRNQAVLDKYGANNAIKGSYFSAVGHLGAGVATGLSYGISRSTPISTGSMSDTLDSSGEEYA